MEVAGVERLPSRPRTIVAQGRQGATAIAGKFYVSSSRGKSTQGSVYTFTKTSGPTEHTHALPRGPEDLSYWPSKDQLWTLAEHPGNRSVLAIKASSF